MIAAEHTKHVTLATNVAIAFPRSPLVTSQIAWDLQQYSGGRFKLGLGTQGEGHNELRYSTPWTAAPLPRLREYIQAMKAQFESFADPRSRRSSKASTTRSRSCRRSSIPARSTTPRRRSTSPR
jgi:alkanesulfonate monooxygenase SsuD/methylene tetrahydromethanopterin reductase-like flavin-dependent oxidoreductase (luciferase family)